MHQRRGTRCRAGIPVVYPLMQVLNRITGKDVPDAPTMHSVVQELYNGVE